MYIKRKIEGEIIRFLKRPEIMAVIGPRQCGKTTTIKKIYSGLKNATFLTFEDQEILNLFENDIKSFVARFIKGKSYVFIDEFQYAKKGGKLLKYIYDVHHTKIIISGSSALDLTIKAAKYLVGRVFILEMLPFDFEEYLSFRDSKIGKIYERDKNFFQEKTAHNLSSGEIGKIKKYFTEYSIWGGYPAVILSHENEKEEVLKNIYNTYFLRDVKDILGLVDDYKLSRLIKSLAFQIGNMIEYNELSKASEFSYPTLKKYLNFLNKTYIVGFSSPFFKNKRKEIVKNQKVYFFDLGLRNFVVNDFRDLHRRPDGGNLLENAIWSQLVKNKYNPQFWRDKNKNEIDFVVDIGEGRLAAIEAKMNCNKCKIPPIFKRDYPNARLFCACFDNFENKSGSSIFAPLL
jgi:predicted AAA+ superfamily ATPase